jgi:hypothetical protein
MGKIVKGWRMESTAVTDGHRGMAAIAAYNCDYEQKHRNHKPEKCDSVFKVFGSPEKVVAIAAHYCNQVNLRNKMSGKGGRPIADFGRQFEVSFPKGWEPKTKDDWKGLAEAMLRPMAEHLGVKLQDLAKHSFGTVHMNKKNPHMDIVVSKAINGKIHSKINSNHLSNKVRASVNAYMSTKLKLSYDDYKPISRGRKQKWQHEQKQAEKAQKAAIQERKATNQQGRLLQKVGKVFKSYGNTLSKWFEAQDERTEQKLVKKMQRQISASIEYGATEEMLEQFKTANNEAEQKKKRKTGLNFPHPPAP